MNDDYLWDKTGQPDPEIQQLEEILGTLRYKPRPLKLPKRRRYFPLLAIAASLLLAIVAGSIWLRVRSRSEIVITKVEEQAPKSDEAPQPSRNKSAANPPVVVAVNNRHRNKSAASVLPKRDREEALMAKEQLMVALRLTSEKLSLLHKKTQIKNQHKVG